MTALERQRLSGAAGALHRSLQQLTSVVKRVFPQRKQCPLAAELTELFRWAEWPEYRPMPTGALDILYPTGTATTAALGQETRFPPPAGLDAATYSERMSLWGKEGGRSKSKRKIAAAKANLRLALKKREQGKRA